MHRLRLCAEKCPKKVDNDYDENLKQTKGHLRQVRPAVPLKYAIDDNHCIYLTKRQVRGLQEGVPRRCHSLRRQTKSLDLRVGSIVLAFGGRTFDPQVHDTYGYTKHPTL